MEGDPSPIHSPGSKQAQGSCDIFNVPENVRLAYVPIDEDVWTPEMEQAQREQNRRPEEEEERARQEVLRHEAEEDEDDQPLSAIALEPKTPVSESSTDGLRYVCDCDIERGCSALYYRKIKRPALTSEREGRYPWLLGWFRGLYVSCPSYGGAEDTFKAAVVNQMLRGHDTCSRMMHSPFLLFQAAVLLGQLGGSPIDGFSSDCSVLTIIPPDNRSQSAPRTPLPLPDKTGNFGWQPGMCTLAASASSDAVYSVYHDGIPLGHDTCSRMMHSPFLLFQLKKWPWQSPVAPLAATIVMRSVTRTDITDSVEVVDVSCHAIVHSSIVYDLYEVPNASGIPTAALCSALQQAGHDLRQDSLASLL
ncbi:hypothetical protein HPB50_014023 [Hyalomma asiaticum]|uniref:Uncharacterized protein n=1 Tax=Hyalomma asiaticum TaxID=266040 RepID=A0ACB7T9T1_HYAAI|nr:hypothetical protein HPB50_014023 [Hyalomma asiaticum]